LARFSPKLEHSLFNGHQISTAASIISAEHEYQIQANTIGFDHSNMAIMAVQHRFSIFGQIFIFEPSFLELNQT